MSVNTKFIDFDIFDDQIMLSINFICAERTFFYACMLLNLLWHNKVYYKCIDLTQRKNRSLISRGYDASISNFVCYLNYFAIISAPQSIKANTFHMQLIN